MAEIRKAVLADAAGIAHVHVTSWQETYKGMVPDSYLASLSEVKRAAQWTEWLTAEKSQVFVAEEGGRIVGFVNGGKCQRPELKYEGELAAIYLLRSHQKLGIGRKLFETFIDAMKARGFRDMCLWVIPENSTVDFYKKLGGKMCGEDKFELGGKELIEHLYVWQLA